MNDDFSVPDRRVESLSFELKILTWRDQQRNRRKQFSVISHGLVLNGMKVSLLSGLIKLLIFSFFLSIFTNRAMVVMTIMLIYVPKLSHSIVDDVYIFMFK